MLIDTHAHLDYPDFAADFDAVIQRANEAGVTRIITIGTSIESSRRAVHLAEKYPNVFAVIGVHPTSEDAPDDVMTPLGELARSPRVAAIGETGLDYHALPSVERRKTFPAYLAEMPLDDPDQASLAIHDGAVKSKQASLFQQQLDLAVELGLSVVVHQRDSWADTLDILRPYARTVRAVFHCFGGSLEQAEEVLAMGHLVSFTGIVTFKNGKEVREVAAKLSLGDFMVETDCPYLAPVPHRGKRCEPAHTRLVAESIAAARGIALEDLARATTDTTEDFFRLAR
jgi:TatD DNase family protein